MQLTLTQKIDLAHTGDLIASAALNDNSMAAVLYDSNVLPAYKLVVQTIETDAKGAAQVHTAYHDLAFISRDDFKYSLSPLALIAWDEKPCVLMNKTTAYWFNDDAQNPKRIDIQGADEHLDDLRLNRHHRHSTTQTDSDLIAISLQQSGGSLNSKPRCFGLLKMDTQAQSLRWVFSGELSESSPSVANLILSNVGMGSNTLKIDSLLIRNNTLYVFCPGVADSDVNRWGMDFYCVKQASIVQYAGKYTLEDVETIYESESQDPFSAKKTGAFGFFNTSGDALLLTPVFASDDWKGKPKLYDLASNSLQDIAMPRGVSKGLFLQMTQSHAWYHKSVLVTTPKDQLDYSKPAIFQTTLFCLTRT